MILHRHRQIDVSLSSYPPFPLFKINNKAPFPVLPFSTFHPTTWEGDCESFQSPLSLTLHIQTETMPWSFYLLNLSPTSLFLLESTIFALVQSSFLTLIVLMPPKGSPYFSHRHSNPFSKMLSDWSFQKVILSCPCLRSCTGSSQTPDQSPHFLAGYRRPLIFWSFSSLIFCHSPTGIWWSNHLVLPAVLQVHISTKDYITGTILRLAKREL